MSSPAIAAPQSVAEKKTSPEFIEHNENACVVCFKNTEIYSIGNCDHPVCYECSTRMRVLCQQNECPICRQDLQKVIFTYEILPYRQLETKIRSGLYDKKYRICFATTKIQKEFFLLLDNPCPECDVQSFYTFDALKDHVRKEHELFYCDLCTENLKIFSFEKRCYTRQDLALHRRKGDPDNTSHRGHPLCKYCDCRFLDRDELFRHLRREHYYCHFCDADGANHFYNDYDSLREHFKSEHYMCEEGECAEEQFTAVFRTDIDLKAHKAHIHGKSLGKVASKQARTLEFEFTLAPRNRLNQNGETSRGSMRIRNDPQMEFEIEDQSSFMQMPHRTIDHQNESEFPSLGGSSGGTTAVHLHRPNVSIRAHAYGFSNIAKTKENFPALGGQNSGGYDPGPSLSGSSTGRNTASAILKSTPSVAANKPAGMVIHVSNRPKSTPAAAAPIPKRPTANDFPALPHSNKHHLMDFIEAPQPVKMSAIAAKHKMLFADNYVPVGQAPTTSTKINVVKTEAEPVAPPSPAKKVIPPKLSSKDNFPELSAPSASSLTASWPAASSARSRVEPKKLKVAPAPILLEHKSQSMIMSNKNKFETNGTAAGNKKEKKKETQIQKTSAIVNNNNKGANNKTSSKENNNNNNVKDGAALEKKLTNLKLEKDKAAFPQLSATHAKAAPPGFESKSASIKQPPPGFNKVTLNSVARPQNNLTFTTSLGESFNILPTHRYEFPSNASKRNQTLVTNFQQTLSALGMEQFRTASQMFREGTYGSQVYYEHCQEALGEKFDEIFPELLALLPDIAKQQELYLVHTQKSKEKSKSIAKKNRGQNKIPKLEVCSTCKQVLISTDLLSHLQNHSLENNFPVLTDNLDHQNSSTSSAATTTTSRKPMLAASGPSVGSSSKSNRK